MQVADALLFAKTTSESIEQRVQQVRLDGEQAARAFKEELWVTQQKLKQMPFAPQVNVTQRTGNYTSIMKSAVMLVCWALALLVLRLGHALHRAYAHHHMLVASRQFLS
jgi:hypothetical protein